MKALRQYAKRTARKEFDIIPSDKHDQEIWKLGMSSQKLYVAHSLTDGQQLTLNLGYLSC